MNCVPMIYTQCQILYVYSLMLKTWKFSFNENVLYITKQRKSIKHWKYKKKNPHTQKQHPQQQQKPQIKYYSTVHSCRSKS